MSAEPENLSEAVGRGKLQTYEDRNKPAAVDTTVPSRNDLESAERNVAEAEARIERQRELIGELRAGGDIKVTHESEDLLARMLIMVEQLKTVRLLIATDLHA